MMKTVVFAAAAFAAATAIVPVVAQPAPRYARRHPETIAITMTENGFVPRRFVLRQGASYVLSVVNRSAKGHNLTQQAFFRQARVAYRDQGMIRGGRISLEPGQSAVVHFFAPVTRPGGKYEFASDVLGDSGKEYTGVFAIQ